MIDMEENYEKIVTDLNQELYDRFGEVERYFSYSTTGFMITISFDGLLIWNSESDDRRWINDEEKESLEVYVRRNFNAEIDKLYSLKLP